MKPAVLITGLAFLAALGLWFLSDDDRLEDVEDVTFDLPVPPPRAPETPIATGPVRPAPADEPAPEAPEPSTPQEIRFATIRVLPVWSDGDAVDADTITVQVRSNFVNEQVFCTDRDRETGVWTFEKTPVGSTRITVWGDLVRDTVRNVDVEADGVEPIRVAVQPGALIHYRAKRLDDSQPEAVTLELRDEADRPAKVRYQVRLLGTTTSPRLATSHTQGPEGDVYGIPPGRYRLHAKTAGGETAVVELVLEAGQRTEVDLELR